MKRLLISLVRKISYHWRKVTLRSYKRRLSVVDVSMEISVDDLFAERVYKNDRLWPELEWVVKNVKADSGILFDIGANQGITSLFYAKTFPSSTVVAVEPLPFNVGQIVKNSRMNNTSNILISHCAVSDHVGQVFISNHSNSSVVNSGNISVPVCLLDSFCLDNVKFIKVDVEGLEEAVLHGAINIIEKCKPALDVELHLFIHKNPEEVFKRILTWLTQFNYHFDAVAGFQGSVHCDLNDVDVKQLSREHVVNLLCRQP